MSGPIVRSGPSPEFSKNWESVFGGRSGGATSAARKKPAKKAPVKVAAKKAVLKKTKKSGK